MVKRNALVLIAVLCTVPLPACDAVRGAAPDTQGPTTIEAAIFEGGYGVQWHKKIAQQFNDRHAGQGPLVNLWGDPRVAEKIKPRILRGDPPEIVLSNLLPIWRLISAEKLHPFDTMLDMPITGLVESGATNGSATTLRDLFMPGTLEAYSTGGRVYAVPTIFGAWSCWYDAALFDRHGWRPPATWDQFLQLCEAIKAEGIAPIAYQGKYPNYGWFTLASLIQRCGGVEAINRINAIEPGAFSHPDAVRAAALLQQMAQDYFQPGAMAMTHTESQLQFINGNAAMIFCGVWLENEMKNNIRPGFELRCFNVPQVEGGKGNPHLFNGQGTEYLMVPADSTHPEEAMEFLRYLISPQTAGDMCQTISVISPLRGCTPRDAVSPALRSVLDMIDRSPGNFDVRIWTLVIEWTNQVMQPNLSALMRGDITPEAFGQVLDEGLQRLTAKPGVIIPDFIPYDPEAYGEPWQ